MSTGTRLINDEVRSIRDKSRKHLLELGKDANEIELKLKEKGRKGFPKDEYACPLVNELLDLFPKEVISVDYGCIMIDGCRLYRNSRAKNYFDGGEIDAADPENVLPDHIWDFAERFDNMEYPDLVDPSYDEDEEGDDDWDDDDDDDDDEDDDDDDDDDEDFENLEDFD
jgi:hypothetical protein